MVSLRKFHPEYELARFMQEIFNWLGENFNEVEIPNLADLFSYVFADEAISKIVYHF